MSTPAQANGSGLDLGALDAITDAVESGAGLPAVIRAAARALDASLVLLDRGGTVLAAAARSPADERSLLAGGAGVDTLDLRVADEPVGALRMRARSDPGAALVRLVTTLVASEVERVRAPERASAEALTASSARSSRATSPSARTSSRAPASWASNSRTARRSSSPARTRSPDRGRLAPARARGRRPRRARGRQPRRRRARGARRPPGRRGRRAPARRRRRARGAHRRRARPRAAGRAPRPHLRHRPQPSCFGPERSSSGGQRGALAANVAEGDARAAGPRVRGDRRLPAAALGDERGPGRAPALLRRDRRAARRLRRAVRDGLVQTVEAFLEADGNVAGTAQRLFTHRHTIRYRLERVRELTGLDVGSTDGREKLSLGLKAMRVLGISHRGGPGPEAGAEGGPRAAPLVVTGVRIQSGHAPTSADRRRFGHGTASPDSGLRERRKSASERR